jgi:hypothetical protein
MFEVNRYGFLVPMHSLKTVQLGETPTGWRSSMELEAQTGCFIPPAGRFRQSLAVSHQLFRRVSVALHGKQIRAIARDPRDCRPLTEGGISNFTPALQWRCNCNAVISHSLLSAFYISLGRNTETFEGYSPSGSQRTDLKLVCQ